MLHCTINKLAGSRNTNNNQNNIMMLQKNVGRKVIMWVNNGHNEVPAEEEDSEFVSSRENSLCIFHSEYYSEEYISVD